MIVKLRTKPSPPCVDLLWRRISIPNQGRWDGREISTPGILRSILIAFSTVVCSRHAAPMVLVTRSQTNSGAHFKSPVEQFVGACGGRKPQRDSRFCSHSCIMFSAIPAVLVRSSAVPSDISYANSQTSTHLSTRRRAACTGSRSSVPTCCAAGIDNRRCTSARTGGKHQRDARTPGSDQPVHAS